MINSTLICTKVVEWALRKKWESLFMFGADTNKYISVGRFLDVVWYESINAVRALRSVAFLCE